MIKEFSYTKYRPNNGRIRELSGGTGFLFLLEFGFIMEGIL